MATEHPNNPPPAKTAPQRPGPDEEGYSKSPLAARDSMRETYRQKLEREDEAWQAADDIAFRKTQGIQNDDLRDVCWQWAAMQPAPAPIRSKRWKTQCRD